MPAKYVNLILRALAMIIQLNPYRQEDANILIKELNDAADSMKDL